MLAPKLGVLPPCLRAAVLLGGAALTLLSPVAAGTAQTAEPGQPRRGIPLPARAEPLPPAMQEKVAPLLEAAVRFRGLGLQRPIPLFRLEESELERALEALFAGDLPLVYSQPAERVLEIFGLIPPEMDLRDYSRRLLASQLAAYYEDSFEYIAVVEREGESTLAPLGGGEAVAERLEESLLVHEIAHALQDQHFDIGRFWDHEPFSDRSLAAEALVEGDATLVMLSFLVNLPVERFPPGDGPLDPLMVDAAQFTEMAPELPGDEELRAAPAYLREHLLFPYLQGLAFCLELRRTGGQKLLDHAFRQDPPVSSEQILHAEKWLGERDEPVRIELPDLAAMFGGGAKKMEGSFGELDTRLILSQRLGEDAQAAAAGWGGDAFALYEVGGREVLVWVTEWDTLEDAEEFRSRAASAFREGWHLAAEGPE